MLALVFFDQLGDFIVYAVCSWGVTVVCALVGFLSFAQIARFYLQQACHGRDRSTFENDTWTFGNLTSFRNVEFDLLQI